MTPLISVVIPAYNESLRIGDTVSALKSFPEIGEILVIDDGSTDDTGRIAAAAGARVWTNKKNLGKGAALNIGAALARGQVILFLDADLGETAREAAKLWEPVLAGRADCAIAKFPKARRRGGFGLVKKLAHWGVQRYGGRRVSAVLSGQRAFTRQALEAVFPLASGYGAEVGATIRLLQKGYRIVEVDLALAHRETGRDLRGFLHRGRQFHHILRVLAGEALR